MTEPTTTDNSCRLYKGRFAPSPTGPLHFGSLVAALASYLQANTNNGEWHIRIDNIDPPREQAGAVEDIIQTLHRYGFQSQGSIQYQSRHQPRYALALQQLDKRNRLYACQCSRKQIAAAAQKKPSRNTHATLVYQGTCRELKLPLQEHALRFKLDAKEFGFNDFVFGFIAQNTLADVGDFVLQRRDGLVSYQLANVVDDQDDSITEIVRGADLLHNTPRQIALINALDYRQLDYLHLPVAVDSNGIKLSKQSEAAALSKQHVLPTLWQAWSFLGQTKEAECRSVSEFWQFGCAAWNPDLIPRELERPAP